MNAWSVWWLSWFSLTAGSFLGAELYTLWTGQAQNSLSAQVWALESAVPGQSVLGWTFLHVWIAGILATLTIWTLVHLVFAIWR